MDVRAANGTLTTVWDLYMSNFQIGTCDYGYYNPPKNWLDEYVTTLPTFNHDVGLIVVNRISYTLPGRPPVKNGEIERTMISSSP